MHKPLSLPGLGVPFSSLSFLLDRVKKAADIKVSAQLAEQLKQYAQKPFYRRNTNYNVSVRNKYGDTFDAMETNNYNETQNVSENIVENEYSTVNKTDVHNSGIPIIRNAGAEKSSDNKKSVFNDLHNVYENAVGNEYSTVNKTDIHNSSMPNRKNVGAEKSLAEKHSDNSRADVRSTVYVPKVQRLADRLNTVTNLLERMAGEQSVPAVSGRQNTGRDKTKENALAAGGTDSVYGDTSNSFVFNNTFNAYTLGGRTAENNANTTGGSAADRSTLATNITLLPIFGYEKMILPEKTQRVLLSGKRAADKMHILPMRNDIIKNRSINIINNRLLTSQGGAAVNASGDERAAEAADMQMPQAEHQSVALRYRDNAAVSAANDHSIHTAPQQPSQAELIKQFGNLIEGADAGLTPSFEVGTHGVSEAMAAIEQTAEKVQMNSKLIEEIREKQRMIEEVTLKSSDMDAISDEMIRKLRSQLRLDKSRFAQ